MTTPTITVSPLARVLRTLLQLAVSIGVAIPIILNSGVITSTKVVSILGSTLIVVTTLQNVLEHFGIMPVVGGKPVPLAPAK